MSKCDRKRWRLLVFFVGMCDIGKQRYGTMSVLILKEISAIKEVPKIKSKI